MRGWRCVLVVVTVYIVVTFSPCEADAASVDKGGGYADAAGYADAGYGGIEGYGEGAYGADAASVAVAAAISARGAQNRAGQSPVQQTAVNAAERSTKENEKESKAVMAKKAEAEKNLKHVAAKAKETRAKVAHRQESTQKERLAKEKEKGIKEAQAKKLTRERGTKEKSAKQAERSTKAKAKAAKERKGKTEREQDAKDRPAKEKNAKRKRWIINPPNEWPAEFHKHCQPNSHSLNTTKKRLYPKKPCPDGFVWACTGETCQGLHFDTSKQKKAVRPLPAVCKFSRFASNCRVFKPAAVFFLIFRFKLQGVQACGWVCKCPKGKVCRTGRERQYLHAEFRGWRKCNKQGECKKPMIKRKLRAAIEELRSCYIKHYAKARVMNIMNALADIRKGEEEVTLGLGQGISNGALAGRQLLSTDSQVTKRVTAHKSYGEDELSLLPEDTLFHHQELGEATTDREQVTC